jgi:hypothetical protein
LLIVGKEKGFDPSFKEQLELESINNPVEWGHYITNKIGFYKTRYKQNSRYYLNSYYPYDGKMKSGHTWTKYGSLTKLMYPELGKYNNDFLSRVFITEVNYKPAKYSTIKNFTFEDRLKVLNHEFYRNFKIIVLACGEYLSVEQIEKTFDVKFKEDISRSGEKLIIYKNQNRILIHTRQLSMAVKSEYLERIKEQVEMKEK